MKILRDKSLEGETTLNMIRNAQPFRLPGHNKIYIKVYPCTSYPGIYGLAPHYHELLMVIDLEQGGIVTMDHNAKVILMDYEFKITGEKG